MLCIKCVKIKKKNALTPNKNTMTNTIYIPTFRLKLNFIKLFVFSSFYIL